MEELLQVLEKTLAPDQAELQAANQYLAAAAANNLPTLLSTLSDILKNGGNSQVARMQAGIQLKNQLYSKDYEIKLSFQQRWLAFPESLRTYIKNNVLSTLGSENRPSQAAQCVASIACAELPQNLWPALMNTLVNNVTTASSTEMMKEASLETIGYICQDIEPEHLTAQSNAILTAIVHGMKKDETSEYVRLAATNALLNSLDFTKANFANEAERNFIMQVVCEATQSSDTHVKVAAMQCLVKIMSLHYTCMEAYMGQALFAITIEAMKSDVDEIALQGIEFWSSVCDEEVDLGIELQEAQDMGCAPERVSMHYAKSALPYLVPLLTDIMTRQDNETEDDDEWNPCKAAGVSLMLLATCCEDDIVAHVMPFVSKNIASPEWNRRDAAIMAFGSILEGPDVDKMKPMVAGGMPDLINLLRDPSPAVRDTVAWTIGRVCELLPEAALASPALLVPLVEGLVAVLDDVPRVAANASWAFSSLADAAYESAEIPEDAEEPPTYCLSTCFGPVVEKLLHTTERPDGNQSNLRSAAYEALMEMIKNSAQDCYEVVKKTTLVILERLHGIIQMEAQIQSTNDRTQYNDLQSLLCATLQSVIKRVTKEDIPHISEPIMSALLQMLHSSSQASVQSQGDGAGTGTGVQEDALLAVSALIEKLGADFNNYMPTFGPYLISSLKNTAEYQVCFVAVNCVGDLCRALQLHMKPYADEIMTILLQILGDHSVDRSIKPGIISVFGDVALAVGPDFKSYLQIVMQTLQQAAMLDVNKTDYDMVDYLNELRENCLEAYTGIVQGLKGEDGGQVPSEVNLLLPYANSVIAFIELVAIDTERTDSVTSAACGLIGDLAMAFGQNMLPLADKESVANLINSGRKSKQNKTKTLATWAYKELRKLRPT